MTPSIENIITTRYFCSQIDFPFCSILTDQPCDYMGRLYKMGPITIFAPSAAITLAIIVLCAIRIINTVNSKYSGIGRKEFVLFLYLYTSAVVMDMPLITNVIATFLTRPVEVILLAIQLGLATTCVWALFISSVMSYTFYKGGRVSPLTLLKILCIMYFCMSTSAIYVFLTIKINQAFFFFVFVFHGVLLGLYFLLQLGILQQIGAEIWGYGTLFIGLLFFIVGILPMFYGANFIALLSERYFDGLGFFHLFSFCSIVMIHKFWLSVYDDEMECAAIAHERGEEERRGTRRDNIRC